ncbi:hypothetical protein [Halosimplex halophilum]|uniref:hypothetical protein n=1 Tax=Halosimplex halophilum TaxID=2559572 RepID=UPI00107EF47D|nr:hypothetical protein [Halosimplex halophilum]
MRRKLLALAAAAVFVLGTGSVVAATATDSPAAPATGTPAPVEPPDNYTVATVDPDDELDAATVEDAWRTAWANETVRDAVDGERVRFEVWAPVTEGDPVSVWVARNETAPTRVVADVSNGSVVAVDEPAVVTADEFERDKIEIERVGNGTTRFGGDEASGGSPPSETNATRLTADSDAFVRISLNDSEYTVSNTSTPGR